jgi:hypothetical protein
MIASHCCTLYIIDPIRQDSQNHQHLKAILFILSKNERAKNT